MSNPVLEIVGLVRVELPPLEPKQGPTWELLSVRVSGRLFFGSKGIAAAELGGDLAGLVAGVDYLDVERYTLTRIRNLRQSGAALLADPDPVFDLLAEVGRGDSLRVVIHRTRSERTGTDEQTRKEYKYYTEREQVLDAVKLAATSPAAARRLAVSPVASGR